jgi:GMP synthase-like glutamine amidotransferase
MRIHSLQHVSFEDSAYIGSWAANKGHVLSSTRLFADERCPKIEEFDILLIMGGPMNVYEEGKYPWLRHEKRFIKQAIQGGKIVLGICLGAQLIAEVLGGNITKNKNKEIGWFPVCLTDYGQRASLLAQLPSSFIAFHWHGDTFSIPPRCEHIATNDACPNQGFQYKDRVLGLQFHIEATEISIDRLINNCADEMVEAKFVQKESIVRARTNFISTINHYMDHVLEQFEIIHEHERRVNI